MVSYIDTIMYYTTVKSIKKGIKNYEKTIFSIIL